MDLEKYRVEIGKFFKNRRHDMELTQLEVVGVNDDKIMSNNALSEIEKGKRIPKRETLELLLLRLKTSYEEFEYEIYKETKVRLSNDIKEIGDLLLNYRIVEAKAMYYELQTRPYYNNQNPKNEQIFTFFEGAFLYGIDKEPHKAIKMISKGLHIRRPKIFKAYNEDNIQNEFNFKYIENTALYGIDYRMLNMIAIIMSGFKWYKEAVDLQESIIKSVKNTVININIKNEVLTAVYYNISNDLRDLKEYRKALMFCELGIDLCIKRKTTTVLGQLYSNKGEINGYLGDLKKAHYYFKLSYNQFIINKEPKLAERTKQGALKLFNLEITT
jgi:transcriptional regulator with XRE-family HTH domain